jgi:hypothetical protein
MVYLFARDSACQRGRIVASSEASEKADTRKKKFSSFQARTSTRKRGCVALSLSQRWSLAGVLGTYIGIVASLSLIEIGACGSVSATAWRGKGFGCATANICLANCVVSSGLADD